MLLINVMYEGVSPVIYVVEDDGVDADLPSVEGLTVTVLESVEDGTGKLKIEFNNYNYINYIIEEADEEDLEDYIFMALLIGSPTFSKGYLCLTIIESDYGDYDIGAIEGDIVLSLVTLSSSSTYHFQFNIDSSDLASSSNYLKINGREIYNASFFSDDDDDDG